jgi:cytochrome c oxidase assembly factor CtaG
MPLSWAGPPAPTLHGVWTAWQLDPLLIGVVLTAAALYLLGLAAARRRGRSWPVRRAVAFFGLGLGSLVVTGLGWPAVYAPALFSVYALQVVALLMVVPLLLGLGRPVELAMAALDDTGAARLRRMLDSRPARLITVPVVSPLLLAVVPFVLFFTPWYPATLQHPALHAASNLLLLVIGLAVLVPLWEAGTIAARIPYAIALLCAFIELLADALPGIIIRLDTHVIAAAQLTRPWGASLLHDQQLGGDLLWCIGEAVDVPFLALLAVQWYRSDARHAQQVDQALDAATAEAPDSAGGRETAGELTQPWWEQDASVFGDRAGQYRRRATG